MYNFPLGRSNVADLPGCSVTERDQGRKRTPMRPRCRGPEADERAAHPPYHVKSVRTNVMIDSAPSFNQVSTLSTTSADSCGWVIRKNSTNATTTSTMSFFMFTSTYSVPLPMRMDEHRASGAVTTDIEPMVPRTGAFRPVNHADGRAESLTSDAERTSAVPPWPAELPWLTAITVLDGDPVRRGLACMQSVLAGKCALTRMAEQVPTGPAPIETRRSDVQRDTPTCGR